MQSVLLRRMSSSTTTASTAASTAAAQRLQAIRERMKACKYDAFIVPSADAHQSEYIADCDARRAFISGFTGSAGTAVVTLAHGAHLWTDGRYYLQASQQLAPDAWSLMKDGLKETPSIEQWLASTLGKGQTVAFDATLLTVDAAKRLEETLAEKEIRTVGHTAENLVDLVWAKERPARPAEPLLVLADTYSGQAFAEKLKTVRGAIDKEQGSALVIAALDEIACNVCFARRFLP